MRNPNLIEATRVHEIGTTAVHPVDQSAVQDRSLTTSKSSAGTWVAGLLIAGLIILSPLALIAQTSTTEATAPAMAIPEKSDDPEASESAKLALKLTNPVASLISIPIQNWFDFNLGPKKDGFRYTMEAQPVYPMQISKDWNLISRTTIPVVYQQNLVWQNDPDRLERLNRESLSFSGSH